MPTSQTGHAVGGIHTETMMRALLDWQRFFNRPTPIQTWLHRTTPRLRRKER